MCQTCSLHNGHHDHDHHHHHSHSHAHELEAFPPEVGDADFQETAVDYTEALLEEFTGTLIRLPPGGLGGRPFDPDPPDPIGKWGPEPPGTPGGVITWSIVGAGLEPLGGAPGLTLAPDEAYDFDIEPILQNVFAQWSSVADIEFDQVPDDGSPLTVQADGAADIRIAIADTQSIGALGYAFFPQVGDIVMDDDLESAVPNFEAESAEELFFAVVLHEVGHSLGLPHSNVFTAVMAPGNFLTPTSLQPDDVNRIQALYGAQDETITVPGVDLPGRFAPQLLANPTEFVGNELPNEFVADAGDDTLHGEDGNDTLDGGAGNDLLVGGRGLDRIEGNLGLDTAAFGGGYAPNRLSFTQDAILVRGGDNRVDTVTGVERFAFDNGVLAFDLPGSELGFVYRLYTAAFGREADSGVLFWQDALWGGLTRLDVAEAFVESAEFEQLYGAPDDAGYIDALYLNVFGRAADDGGREFWLTAFAEGTNRAEMLANFTESDENIALTEDALAAGVFFDSIV